MKVLPLLGFIVLGALFGAACADEIYLKNQEGNKLFVQGDYAGALGIYRAAQVDRPDLRELDYNSGNALYKAGDFQRSLGDYDKALGTENSTLKFQAHYNKGNAFFRLNRLLDARDAYKEALKLNPSDVDAKFNLEYIDRLLEQQEREQQRQPQQEGQGPPQDGQPQPGEGQGQPQPNQGQPQPQPGQGQSNDQQPGEGRPEGQPGGVPSLGDALRDFRADLSLEEALRVLEALRAQQQGIEGLLRQDAQPGRRAPGFRDW